MSYPINPHFTFPFQRSASGIAAVQEQDSEEEIMDCVEVLLSTEIGERMELPEYGLPDQTFSQGGADIERVSGVVQKWEPRARHTITRTELTDLTDRVRISIRGGGDVR